MIILLVEKKLLRIVLVKKRSLFGDGNLVPVVYGSLTKTFGKASMLPSILMVNELPAMFMQKRRPSVSQNLKQHIIDYKKTRDVYMAYHKAGYSKKFLSEHESDIIKHKAAKKFFDDRGMTKWPKIKKLRADFDELVAKKRTLNAERKKIEKEVRELQMAQYFVDRAYGDAEKTEKERKTVLR